jgi:hypothetical protein
MNWRRIDVRLGDLSENARVRKNWDGVDPVGVASLSRHNCGLHAQRVCSCPGALARARFPMVTEDDDD